jgi:hypothetical protein
MIAANVAVALHSGARGEYPGFVVGEWGTYRDFDRGWVVVHLPTGLTVTDPGDDLTHAEATSIIRALELLDAATTAEDLRAQGHLFEALCACALENERY